MASIPVFCFSAPRVHKQIKAHFEYDESTKDGGSKSFRNRAFEINKVLPNYSGKLMNSIWGQYNLYAAHAFQKNNESAPNVRCSPIPQVKNLWESLHTI